VCACVCVFVCQVLCVCVCGCVVVCAARIYCHTDAAVRSQTRKGKSVRQAVLTRKNAKKSVKVHLAHGVAAGNKSISRTAGFFRQDLVKSALQRFTQIRKSFSVVAKPATKKSRRQAK
jgi:hypothetical protein